MSLRPPDLRPGEALAAARRTSARAVVEGAAEAAYATLDSPLGRLVAVATPRGLARIAYERPDGGIDAILDDVARRLSPALVEAPAQLDAVRRELEDYFQARRTRFELELDWALAGGAFSRRVLHACAAIPFGRTSTYRQIAEAAGSPRGYRAAGNALGANPLPIVVPCHRVLATAGGLGGYTGGLDRKRALLAIEAAGAGPPVY